MTSKTRSTKWRRRTNPETISFNGVGLQGGNALSRACKNVCFCEYWQLFCFALVFVNICLRNFLR